MHASTAFISVVRIENKGSPLVVWISQCKTLAFDPNEVVFLVKVLFLLSRRKKLFSQAEKMLRDSIVESLNDLLVHFPLKTIADC